MTTVQATPYVDAYGNAIVEYQVYGAVGSEPYGAFTQIRERRHGTSTWNDPVTLGVDAFGTPITVDPLGDAFALWGSGVVNPVVQFSERTANGAWVRPGDVAPGDAPIVAADSHGNALAVWWQNHDKVAAAFLQAGSGVWQAPTILGEHFDQPGAIKAGFDAAGNALVIWDVSDGVHMATRTADGTWRSDTKLEDGRLGWPGSIHLVVSPAGEAFAAWAPNCATCGIEGVALNTSGAVGKTVHIGAGSDQGAGFDLAMDPSGNVVAVWAAGDVEAALRPAHSNVWVPTGALGPASAGGPSVAIDSSGHAIAVWATNTGIESSELVGGGPLLANVVIPKFGRPSARIRFGATALPWHAQLSGRAPIWEFGDGSSPTLRSSHVYRRAGVYNVTVSANDAAGATTTTHGMITITNAALANTRRPSIRGKARVGRTLTCGHGAWLGVRPIKFDYAWLRDQTPLAVPDAGAVRYRVTPNDVHHRMACSVTAINATDSVTATSRSVLVRR